MGYEWAYWRQHFQLLPTSGLEKRGPLGLISKDIEVHLVGKRLGLDNAPYQEAYMNIDLLSRMSPIRSFACPR